MHIYRYDRFERPQRVLSFDMRYFKLIRSNFLKLQHLLREVIAIAEEPAFQHSLKELDHALDNFVCYEVDPIMTLFENAQADIDKESTA